MGPRQRQRSVPPPSTTTSESSSSLSEVTTISTPPSLAAPQKPQQPKLLARAEALSRMTYELNIRAAGVQTERLQRQVQALVQSTAEDHEFRQQHEERLTKVWHKMLAVRQHVAKLDDSQDNVQVHLKQCQQETGEVIEQFRREIGGLRELLEGLSSQMDKLPSMAEAMTDADCSLSTSHIQDESRRNEPQVQDSGKCISKAVK
jgi:predicted secreted protein